MLVYSSCSVVAAEAEDHVERFLRENKDAALLPIAHAECLEFSPEAVTPDGLLRVWPWHARTPCDAHFVARFRKAHDDSKRQP